MTVATCWKSDAQEHRSASTACDSHFSARRRMGHAHHTRNASKMRTRSDLAWIEFRMLFASLKAPATGRKFRVCLPGSWNC